jgi:hypothetical protein
MFLCVIFQQFFTLKQEIIYSKVFSFCGQYSRKAKYDVRRTKSSFSLQPQSHQAYDLFTTYIRLIFLAIVDKS